MGNLVSICDVKDDVQHILDLAIKIKSGEIEEQPLEGKTGMYQLGGRAIFLSSSDLQMGRGEPIYDTAKVLSRFVDGIMIRAVEHCDVVELAQHSDVPVISGLTNVEHPCQAFADILTIKEHFGTLENKKICFVGDGNNVCNSLLLIAPILGMDMSVACPKGYEPNKFILKIAKEYAEENNTEITVSDDINVALDNVDVVYTDVWISMGDEAEEIQRKKDLSAYQVDLDLMDMANEGAIFMHCLPAVRGQEVTVPVIDGPHSVIFDQAENRLHAQKAILYHFLKDE